MIKKLSELSIKSGGAKGGDELPPVVDSYTPIDRTKIVTMQQNPNATPSTATAHAQSTQSALCSCTCHARVAVRSPQWLASAFGSLLVNYSRPSPDSCSSCSRISCRNNNESSFQSRYYFPPWMLHRMLSVQCKWNPLSGCNFALITPRAVYSRSIVFTLAQHGNIRGMQRLFEQRTASPYDISIEEGRSALHVSGQAGVVLSIKLNATGSLL